MQLTSQQALPVSQAIAWQALNDIAILQASIPGCESITATGDDQYEMAITAAVGPVKAKFKGKMKLSDIQPPESYTIQFEGQGGAAGHGKGSASVRLEPQGEQACLLHYTATASVGGKLAQIGSRLVDMAAQKMAGDFFAAFERQLVGRYPRAVEAAVATAAATTDPPGLWQRVLQWLGLRSA